MSSTIYKYTIDERVDYYTSKLEKQWVIDFDQQTGKCFYEKNEKNEKKIYEAPLEIQHGTFYMSQNYTNEMYEKIALERFNKRIIDGEKNLPSIDYINSINNYNINAYINPVSSLLNRDIYFKDKYILHRIGDVFFSTEIPIITKTRPTKSFHELALNKKLPFYSISQHNVLLNLDANRHWHEPINKIKENDINFHEKNNKIIWRGAPNGIMIQEVLNRPVRSVLCKKYQNHPNKMIDIGFVHNYEDLKGKEYMSIEDQLKSKFIISVEGGDVATNLKWILYSNSVVMMPTPTMSSWLMEDKLIPWVHYVPLDNDFGDIEEKYKWCLNNLCKCEEIAMNGKKYIQQFLDEDRENQINNLVLRKYVDNIKINLI